MCCRNRPPGQDLELHRRASCRAHQAETQGGLQLTWEEENSLGEKSTHEKHRWGVKVVHRELSEQKVTHLSNSCLMTRKQSAMGRAARRS